MDAKDHFKGLAICLQPLLPQLVGEHQFPFIRGRHIHDNFMIGEETQNYCKVHKQSSVLSKVDFEKANNLVSWSFLLEMLEAGGPGMQ